MKLIFVHGAGNTGEVWYYQTKYFTHGEAITLPGHLVEGKPCTSVEDYADWLHHYVLSKGYKSPVLVGHSLGGAIVQMYALKYPQDVRALILIATGARLRVNPQFLSLLEESIANPSTKLRDFILPLYAKVAPEVSERVIGRVLEVGPAVHLNDFLCCDRFDIMEKVHQIKLPTLVICGTEDVWTPVKYSQYLADKIEDAKLVLVEGGTHLVFMEEPEVVNRAIEEFLSSL